MRNTALQQTTSLKAYAHFSFVFCVSLFTSSYTGHLRHFPANILNSCTRWVIAAIKSSSRQMLRLNTKKKQ